MIVSSNIHKEPILSIWLPIQPKAIQSVRFSARCGYVQTFQPQSNKNWKLTIKNEVYKQLPADWKILDSEPLWVEVSYVFPPLKSFKKADKEWIEAGNYISKDTKPDANDNLNKGLYDALTGILWADDAKVAWPAAVKVYGKNPGIWLSIGVMPKRIERKQYEREDD